MSSFFRRKAKNRDPQPDTRDNAAPQQETAAPQTAAPQTVPDVWDSLPALPKAEVKETHAVPAHREADGPAQSVGASVAEEDAPQSEPKERRSVKPSRENLLKAAYGEWHETLSRLAQNDEKRAAGARYAGQIELTHAHPSGTARFYSHMPTKLSSLIREPRLYMRAKEQLMRLHEMILQTGEEHGYAPVSLSAGRFVWTELPEISDSNTEWRETYDATGELRLDFTQVHENMAAEIREEDSAAPKDPGQERPLKEAVERSAPALFRRVKINFLADGDALLQLSLQAYINPTVLKALRVNGISEDQLIRVRQLAHRSRGIEETVNMLATLGRAYLPGFRCEEQNVLGCFYSPARSMLSDLEAVRGYVHGSGILAAVAGDEECRKVSKTPIPPGLDEDRAPEAERGVGDHDVAELDVVEAVASGRSLVIDAVPGTERISTVASVLADAAASGKSVLYVPAKASQAKALHRALDRLGVGETVLDFTDTESVPLQLRKGLRLPRAEFDAEKTLENREKLTQVRAKLRNFMNDLHNEDPQWGTSVYALLEKLASLTGGGKQAGTRIRFDASVLHKLKDGGYGQIRSLLREARELGVLEEQYLSSAWADSPISDPAEGAKAVERARAVGSTMLPAAISQATRTAMSVGLTQPLNLKEWFEQLTVLDGVAESLDIFLPKIFENSVRPLIAATATKEWRDAHNMQMRGSERREYRRELEELLRAGAAPEDIHTELLKVEERRNIWCKFAVDGRWPVLPEGMVQIRATRADLQRELECLARETGKTDFFTLPFNDLERRLRALVDDALHMDSLPRRNAVLAAVKSAGLMPLMKDLQSRNVPVADTDAEFDLALTSSIFEQILAKSQILASLGPKDVSDLLSEWKKLDLAQVQSLAGPVMSAVIGNARRVMQMHREDTLKLDALLARYSVAALRDVIATYPRLVQCARPIWIVPSVLVADYVPPMPWVDLVILDTAENTETACVVPTLLRGRQIVVVGDIRRCGVKTGNFTGKENDTLALRAFADVLPVAELPTYRVKQDELTVKSLAAYGYAGVYHSVPASPRRHRTVLRVVDGRGVPTHGSEGAVEAPQAEVDAVTEAVKKYAREGNTDSLAVVTVSELHARRIREALQSSRAESGELDRFMRAEGYEPFTVIDIGQTAGIRRDRIIFTPGFGKTVHGRVLHSFGKLHTDAGFLGLLDAIEMPRKSMTIISSLDAGDIDISRVATAGPQLLAKILDTAGGDTVSRAEFSAEPPGALLGDLARRLQAAGLRVGFNYGCGDQVRIPLVVGDDSIPGMWAVAVLTDDAQYVAQKSLRRRDRYLVDAFTDRGWLVYQTYSTSLFIDPAGRAAEIEKLVRSAQSGSGEEKHLPNGGRPDARASHSGEERGKRPDFTAGLPLSAYRDEQLDAILLWIASDRVRRSEEELVAALYAQLNPAERNAQTDAVLTNAVRRSGLAGEKHE